MDWLGILTSAKDLNEVTVVKKLVFDALVKTFPLARLKFQLQVF